MEIKECKRCGRPMAGLKKRTDISDICSSCLRPDERAYAESEKFLEDSKRMFGL